jgi:TP901 family phage tail tape measure protein
VALGAEGFTVLAILEARDRASEIFEKCGAAAEKFGETTKAVADEAYESGAKIDEALGRDVSAADRLEIAAARVAAAQAQARESAATLTAAENELRAAQAQAAAAGNEDAGAQERLIAASKAVSAAQKDAAASAKAVKDAQVSEGAALRSSAAAGDENAAAQLKGRDASEESAATLGKVGKVAGLTALGLGVAGAAMVKAASNFQDSTTHLQTDAGVTQQNLGMVRAGILQVSTATGQSAGDITNAMYHIASSGFTAQNGLNILKVAAEGARVGGADLDTTTKTLVGTMTAYYGANLKAGPALKDSTALMNQMIETVSRGDMKMSDLASSLSAVTPVAAATGVSFAQVGGAVATMTAQGMSAQQATQDLANTIRNLKSPNNVASTEMKALGLNANQVSQNLGKAGLTGTLNQLRNAVLSNSQGGTVMLGYLKEMSPAAQSLSNQILAGSISTGSLTTAMKGLNPQQAALVTHFKTAVTSATGLQQTYTGAMSKMMGGATGLNVALMLTGKHAKDFSDNVAAIGAKAKKTSGDVDNWSTIQGTFAFKTSQAKTALQNTGIAIGSALLPAATALLSAVTKIAVPIAEWTAKHKTLTEVIFVSVTALAATVAVLALATKAFKAVKGAVDTVKSVVSGTIGLMKKLGGQSKATADEQAKSARDAASAEEKAAGESAAVQEEKAGEAAAAQETAAGEAAVAQEEAAAESSGSWIAAAASTVAGWAAAGARMIAGAAKWVAEGALKVAAYVAENVFGAEATASAWTLANAAMLAGIGLVIAAVVIAVVEIVKHWHAIVDGVKDAWNAVYDFISKIISDVISFVKSHWLLIVGIITGPLGLAVTQVIQHFTQIKAFVSKIISDVISFVTSHWRLIVSILGGPLGLAIALVTKYWHDIEHWFDTGVSTVLSILRGLAGDMLSIGEDIVRGIWNGISGMGGWLWGQVKSFASNTLHSFESALGIGSPSKYTTVHGQMLGLGLANGIVSSIPKVLGAAHLMAGAVLGTTSGLSASSGIAGIGSSLALSATAAAGSGGGTMNITIDLRGATVANDASINQLANKVGNAIVRQLPQAGYKIRTV